MFFDLTPAKKTRPHRGRRLFFSNPIYQHKITKKKHTKNINMENLAEYDRITQSIQVDRETVKRSYIAGDAKRFRKYILGELSVQMAKKLIEAGYITETWFRGEKYEQCTLTIYVKPLVDPNNNQ